MQSRILFILHLPPPVHGAAVVGRYIKESTVINNEFQADYINLSTSENLKEDGKYIFSKLKRFLKIQLNVLLALHSKKYDLCYVTLTANGPGFYKDVLVVLLLKLHRKKIIYHFHNKGVHSTRRSGLIDLIYRFAFNNTFSILISKHLYPDIGKYVADANVFFCPCGIPQLIIPEKKRDVGSYTKAPCRLLFLSNMMTEKGIYVLLDACKLLLAESVPFECHYVGGWSDVSPNSFQTSISERGLNNVVFVHGPKYNQEKFSFLEESDIFVFPTYYHYETFGLVNLEAMQHKLPIISCPEGGIPDIIIDGENGFLVPQKNAEALAGKIKILIQDPALRVKMGIAGKKRYEELFRLEKFENNMKDILKSAVLKTPFND